VCEKMAKPQLGSGERFAQLKAKLAQRGASNPAALAAWIGRKKYGKQRFQELSAQGRRRAMRTAIHNVARRISGK